MIRSSVDFPQPDGPISDTNSRGATSRSMSSSAVTPVRNDLREALDRDDVRAGVGHATCSGARCSRRRSASATSPKRTSPSAAQTMFVAQSAVGWSE